MVIGQKICVVKIPKGNSKVTKSGIIANIPAKNIK